MVQANPAQGDGIERRVRYASWRTDKEPSPGYSRELISDRVDPKDYDNLDVEANIGQEEDTILNLFRRNVRALGDAPFLGTRPQLPELDGRGKPQFGEYVWQSYTEASAITENFAKGMVKLDLSPEVEGEGKLWRFIGIWAKNRAEWTTTLLASMYYKITTVGFYDAMSTQQVEFILNQTEMTSVVCTADYADKILAMRKQGMAGFLRNLVIMDKLDEANRASAQELNINMYSYQEVVDAGSQWIDAPAFTFPEKNDVYIFSYTSGTTGDSKGVKLTHNNVLSNARCSKTRLPMAPGESVISYLPYTHSFEQILFAFSMLQQVRIGFYTGDPGKIVEDCGLLKPAIFPSVPRLYQRIYAKLKDRFDTATGCKKWLVDRALAAKQAN